MWSELLDAIEAVTMAVGGVLILLFLVAVWVYLAVLVAGAV